MSFTANVPLLDFTCEPYMYVLSDCAIKVRDQCYLHLMYHLYVKCSDETLDYRVCRKLNTKPCRDGACATNAGCVNGDGSLVPKGKSFCTHCPVGFFGDGDNCTGNTLFSLRKQTPFRSRLAGCCKRDIRATRAEIPC